MKTSRRPGEGSGFSLCPWELRGRTDARCEPMQKRQRAEVQAGAPTGICIFRGREFRMISRKRMPARRMMVGECKSLRPAATPMRTWMPAPIVTPSPNRTACVNVSGLTSFFGEPLEICVSSDIHSLPDRHASGRVRSKLLRILWNSHFFARDVTKHPPRLFGLHRDKRAVAKRSPPPRASILHGKQLLRRAAARRELRVPTRPPCQG